MKRRFMFLVLGALVVFATTAGPAQAIEMAVDTVTVPAISSGSTQTVAVTFPVTFSAPPVVVTSLDLSNPEPAAPRVRQITSSGFELVITEPSGEDGNQPEQTVQYWAIEAGVHSLSDGTRLEVGRVATQAVQHGNGVAGPRTDVTVNFAQSFTTTPVLLTSLQTMVNETAAVPGATSSPFLQVAVRSVNTGNMRIALERAEAAPGTVSADETIGYIVIDANVRTTLTASTGTIVLETLRATNLRGGAPSSCYSTNFSTSFSTTPVILASQNSRRGGDGGWVRRCAASTTSVGLVVDEDQHRDNDRNHTREDAGVVAFSAAFTTGDPPVAHYAFDELDWSGAADEVIDGIGGFHGVANLPADTAGGGVVCRTGDFSNTGILDYVTLDEAVLDGASEFTVAVWARNNDNRQLTILSGANASQQNEAIMFFSSATRFNPHREGASLGTVTIPSIADGQYHHLVWTSTASANCLYVDAVLAGCVGGRAGTVDLDAGGLIIAQEQDRLGGGFVASQAWDGQLDELLIFRAVIEPGQIQAIYDNNVAGLSWDGTPRNCGSDKTAEWRMDEIAWNGTAGEAEDSTGSGFDGQALGGVSTIASGKVCAAGDFPANGAEARTALATTLDVDDDVGNQGSMAFWYRANDAWLGGGNRMLFDASIDPIYFYATVTNAGRLRFGFEDSADRDIRFDSATQSIAAGQWVHVTITWDLVADSYEMFLDGVSVRQFSRSSNGQLGETGTLYIGDSRSSYHPSASDGGADGLIDEFQVYDLVLGSSEIADIMAETRPCGILSPTAYYAMDESSFTHVAGDVSDNSGNGQDADSSAAVDTAAAGAAIPGTPGTCRYAVIPHSGAFVFDGITTPIDVDRDLGEELSIAFWYSSDNNWNNGEINQLFDASVGVDRFFRLIKEADGRLRATLETSNSAQLNFRVSSTAGFTASSWHHIGMTLDVSDGELSVFVDGVETAFTFTGAAMVDHGLLTFGDAASTIYDNFGARSARGRIDEVRLYDSELSAAEMQQLVNLTHDCPVPRVQELLINHSGVGISCVAQTIDVSALDANGDVVADYSGAVTLTTQSGRGTWSLASGSGSFSDATVDDGIGNYVFAPADSGRAQFALDYAAGPSPIDIDVFQTDDFTIRDDDSEGTLEFGPSGFTVTASALSNPPPDPVNDPLGSQIAGSNFAVHLAAFGTSATDPDCGIIESYSGAKNLESWLDYVEPSTVQISATLDGNAMGTSSGSSSTHAVTFTNGQAQVLIKYKDAGRVATNFRDASSFPGNTISGSSNQFVVKPAQLRISLVEGAAGEINRGASSATGDGFIAAGDPFAVFVQAVDAEGSVTPNFGNESAPPVLRVDASTLVLPALGQNGTDDDGAIANATAFARSAPGTFSGNRFAWDEVGVIRLTASLDALDYLGAGDVPGVESGNVGRFYPASVDLVSSNLTAACGSFTYMDQPDIQLDWHLQARNRSGGVTRNYDESLLGAAAVGGFVYEAESLDDGVALTSRVLATTPQWRNGEAQLAVTNAQFDRNGITGLPDGPFEALQLGLRLSGTQDSLQIAALDMNAATAGDCSGSCSARRIGAATRVVYGRMALSNNSGPEQAALAVPIQAQYWAGNNFVLEGSDNCSAYTSAALTLSSFTGNLSLGETVVALPLGTATLINGEANPADPLQLSAPGSGNDGSVGVALDVPAWLEYDWQGSGDTDPAATMSFGAYRGHDRIIYWREVK